MSRRQPSIRPGTTALGLASALAVLITSCGDPTASPPSDSQLEKRGSIRVTTSTSGTEPDPDGFLVSVDDGDERSIAPDGSVTFDSLREGGHVVRISGVAHNCSVSGEPTQMASVAEDQTTDVAYVITCTPTTGGLVVTSETVGGNPDPDGYTVTIDGGQPKSLAPTGSVRYPSLAVGTHTLAITGVAANCGVGNDTPSGDIIFDLDIPGGITIQTGFLFQCFADPGTLQVSASTSGGLPDPDGYTLTIDGQSTLGIGINQTRQYRVSAGDRAVVLGGLASNCTIVGGNASRTVNVPSGGTGSTTYNVSCPMITN